MNGKFDPQRKYMAANIVRVTVDFNRKTESDLLAWIERQDNKAGYIKRVIREDMERGEGAK